MSNVIFPCRDEPETAAVPSFTGMASEIMNDDLSLRALRLLTRRKRSPAELKKALRRGQAKPDEETLDMCLHELARLGLAYPIFSRRGPRIVARYELAPVGRQLIRIIGKK